LLIQKIKKFHPLTSSLKKQNTPSKSLQQKNNKEVKANLKRTIWSRALNYLPEPIVQIIKKAKEY
jgi:hypothetical protein